MKELCKGDVCTMMQHALFVRVDSMQHIRVISVERDNASKNACCESRLKHSAINNKKSSKAGPCMTCIARGSRNSTNTLDLIRLARL